jgi:superfamily II DNA or RNA helicase
MDLDGFDIVLEYKDDAMCLVHCPGGLARNLSDHFSFMVPKARFMPAVRNKIWDGRVRLYNPMSRELYAGLAPYVVKYARDNNLRLDVRGFKNILNNLSIDKTSEYLASLNIQSGGNPIVAHDHQEVAFNWSVSRKRATIISATGSGKSLVIYSLCRFWAAARERKTLIIVQELGLLNQLMSDFKDYSQANGWDAENLVHLIFEGQDTETEKPVVISTWQSIYQLPKSYFDQYGQVIGDEVHRMKAKCATALMCKLTKCPDRIGFTGTLGDGDGNPCNRMTIEGLFGPSKVVAMAHDLISKKLLAPVAVKVHILGYSDAERKAVRDMTYPQEVEFIVSHEKRNAYILDLVEKQTTGNTLVLTQYVKTHAKVLHALFLRQFEGTKRPVFYISGEVAAEKREEIRKGMELVDGGVLIANYQTCSTGINIKRLHHIVAAMPTKDEVRLIQTIGRQLRLSGDKTLATFHDITDDMSWKSNKNYGMKSLLERLKIYQMHKYPFSLTKVTL